MGARALRLLPPERGHQAALWGLSNGFGPKGRPDQPAGLTQRLWGRAFENPIAISAGFDKNAVAIAGAMGLGVGFVEVGGVTPRAQTGNPRPRLFRLTADRAAINRLGFNNHGAEAIATRIEAYRNSGEAALDGSRPVGVNLAANSDSADPARDFEQLVDRFSPLADFLTIDISCPNSENGLVFLSPGPLEDLLGRLTALRDGKGLAKPPALLVKIAPDIENRELDILLEIIAAAGIDGITVCNTTTARPDTLTSAHRGERGGLSGKPLFARSTEMLRHVYQVTGGNIPLIGVGGVSSGADAYAKIRAGACLVQLYTAMIYNGPGLITRIKQELADLLAADGFTTLKNAVGSEHKSA
ncbi:MAG: quinone-dependent dihydroorotate dehydrogenase [Alphaproteobacteria bacterium]|nr:quinone-dependent dihydroorotate dehydrogenase [Alphaproteobacteria bacterium]